MCLQERKAELGAKEVIFETNVLACVVKPKFGTFSPISFLEAAILLVSFGERIIAFSLGLGRDD